ncbi:MAG TPA: DUF1800 domain-containing protein [Pirellulales bacterium]
MNEQRAIDPDWAWKPYEPNADQPWNRRRAAHLLRRAGFGATSAELDSAVAAGPQAAVTALFARPDSLERFEADMDRAARTVVAQGEAARLSAWWLYRMLHTPAPLLEKLTLFWHGHFATSAAKVESAGMMYDHFNVLYRGGLGKFEPLVQAMSRDPAMLVWLDSTTNRKVHPNENYARELMELFCLGVGNYTEQDIQEIARTFTGWEVDSNSKSFIYRAHHHDRGRKSFLGASGDYNGEDAVRIVVAQPAAATFIATKLVRFFVADEPAVSPDVIEPLAKQLRDNGFEIQPALETLFASNLFFSNHAIARKVRSPVELAVGLLRALGGTTNTVALSERLDALGQRPLFPPNVKGWDGGRTWINSSTLVARANLVQQLAFAEGSKLGANGLAAELVQSGAESPEAMVDRLAELLLATKLSPEAKRPLVELASQPNRETAVKRALVALAALPEFQLS